ncbi:glutathione-disulfide reductase [Methylocapsa sp. S129]|uniref:glutathione-disulfide reductase n=1 Tax=Methylocapsa sp. S129 TaxID=1641869 RepID=UPI00131DF158|nr:glutathione-disulfide reductase [Methylocapsa sp. S129]
MNFDVDLFVIGAGSGGVRAARIAAGYGARAMVAEEFRIGGTCVIRGCVPKKLLAYASRFADDFADAAGYGWRVGETRFDWPTMVAAKEKEITRLSAIYRANLEKAGVQIIEERAEIAGPQSVLLASGRLISAKHILIATGAAPELAPHVPGLEHAISSNEIFDLKSFPSRLLIVGGGYIAVEFASIFARLGAMVTQVMRADNILRGFDEDMRTGLRDELCHAGILFGFGRLPTRIEKRDGALHVALSNGDLLVVDQILVATGRRPNTDKLGLENVGVALDAAGAVKVDAWSATNVPGIHAVGDVTNRINLTPVAIREGHAFADHVFGGKPVAVDHESVPSAVFATPEIGAVGLTEAQARERYDIVDIYRSSFRPMKATLSGRREHTIMKLVVDGASDRVLGAHILGHEAGEMIQLLGIAVKMKATKADLDATMAVHPTAAEELVTMRTRTARYERKPG